MQKPCSCHIHKQEHQVKATSTNVSIQINHIVGLLQKKFISPFKIIYTIDQKQADFFRARNKNEGCCSSSSITISDSQLTKVEKTVKEVIGYHFLLSRLQEILSYCSQRYENIVKSGQKQNMKITDEVQKFLIDKILSEGINQYLLKIIVEKLKKQTQSISTDVGLWATPATWYQRYPNSKLDNLSGPFLSSLNNPSNGYGISQKIFQENSQRLIKELTILQKDGRFQQILARDQMLKLKNDSKVLNSPQLFIQNSEEEQCSFPELKQIMLTFSSIPFELNAKMNLYCTLNENTQISYYKEKAYQKYIVQAKCLFIVLANFGSKCTLKIKNRKTAAQWIQHISQSSLIIINCEINQYQLYGDQTGLFLFRNWINCLKKV